ncbi:MAG: septum formation family protein [Nocardioides sp.]|uniref:septum formation family protein n=1 Tax=Nocardioides sp. TaxID=35761 RepID=UPI003F123169
MRRHRLVVCLVAALLAVTGCSVGDDPGEKDSTSAPTPTAPPEPDPAPRTGQCHRLSWEDALAPVPDSTEVRCGARHTSETFHVGSLRPRELDQVDSPAVQARVAEVCTTRLRRHAGADEQALRLTMVQPIWFTPSLEQAALGADWFRCDLVVVAGPEKLMRLPRRSAGIATDESVHMCSTSAPGTKAFARVTCGSRHAWRAVSSVDLTGEAYPSAEAADAVLDEACSDAALDHAEDPLNYRWAQERPTREQWRSGRRYGLCWVPVST